MQRAWDHPAPRGARPPAVSHLSPWGHWHVTTASVHASTSCREMRVHAFPGRILQLLQLKRLYLAHAPRPCQHLPGVVMPPCSFRGLGTPVQRKGLEAPSSCRRQDLLRQKTGMRCRHCWRPRDWQMQDGAGPPAGLARIFISKTRIQGHLPLLPSTLRLSKTAAQQNPLFRVISPGTFSLR